MLTPLYRCSSGLEHTQMLTLGPVGYGEGVGSAQGTSLKMIGCMFVYAVGLVNTRYTVERYNNSYILISKGLGVYVT